MGGGTPILEANRIGCQVTGFDINPMSYWIVKQEIEHLDLVAYTKAAEFLRTSLEKEIGHLYRTRCILCGSLDAHVKYFLWVKVKSCHNCGKDIDLFSGYLLSADSRHPRNVFGGNMGNMVSPYARCDTLTYHLKNLVFCLDNGEYLSLPDSKIILEYLKNINKGKK